MKLSKENKDALISSLLVGVAFGALCGGLLLVAGRDSYLFGAIGGFVSGVITGLLTTWDIE